MCICKPYCKKIHAIKSELSSLFYLSPKDGAILAPIIIFVNEKLFLLTLKQRYGNLDKINCSLKTGISKNDGKDYFDRQ